MTEQEFTLKEVVVEMRDEIKEIRKEISAFLTEHQENTAFRKRAMNAIVGAAFLALAAVGVAVLKVTGIIRL
jgi:hypothetical protein